MAINIQQNVQQIHSYFYFSSSMLTPDDQLSYPFYPARFTCFFQSYLENKDDIFTANVVKEYLLLQSQFSIAVFTKQVHFDIARDQIFESCNIALALVSTATLLQSSLPGPLKGSIFVINCGAIRTFFVS